MISSMNTGLSSRLHPRRSSFVLSWSAGASAPRTMKAQDTKKAFKPKFPNFPAIGPKAKFFEPRVPCVTRYCAFGLPDSPKNRSNCFINKPESGLF